MVTESVGWKGGELDDLTRHQLDSPPDRHRVTDVVQNTDQRLRESLVRSVDELQRLPYNVVGFSEETRRRNRELKDFLYKNLYRHYRVMRMAVKAERIITAPVRGLLQRTLHPAPSTFRTLSPSAAWNARSAITSPA